MYKRDFKKLTKEEIVIRNRYQRSLKHSGWKYMLNDFINLTDECPAAFYNLSLFPNNRIILDYLDGDLKDSKPGLIVDNFNTLLNNDTTNEREVLNFINHNYGYFIISAIAKDYSNWGHHELYVFPEFQLGNEYKVDYLIVGSNSEGYHMMLVELESVYQSITMQNGDFGTKIRKGISQINDWKEWLEVNFSYLKNTFSKHTSADSILPDELFTYDSSRITFAVVAGRRDDFNTRTYKLKRKSLIENRTAIIHYDNLIDYARRMIQEVGFGGENYISKNGVNADYNGIE